MLTLATIIPVIVLGKELKVKALTLKALLLAVILGVVVAGYTAILGPIVYPRGVLSREFSGYQWGRLRARAMWASGLAVWLILVMTLLNAIKKRLFSRQEITVIVIALLFSAWLPAFEYHNTFFFWLTACPGIAACFGKDALKYYKYLPSIFGPQDIDYWRNVVSNSLPVDFGPLGPLAGAWILFMIGLTGTMFFAVMLFRRVWIDVEALQFPLADILGEMVINAEPENRFGKLYKSKWFLIGFLLQAGWVALVTFPAMGERIMTPGAEEFTYRYGWILNIIPAWPRWKHEILSTAALPWVPLHVTLVPWHIGWGLMLSMDVLIGFLVGWFIFFVLWPLIGHSLGYFGAYKPGKYIFAVLYPLRYYYQGGGGCEVAVTLGLTLGVFIAMCWRNREIILKVLKGIITEPSPEVDPARPLSYRFTWIGLILCIILALIGGAALNLLPQVLLVYMILLIIITVATARIVAETGGWWGTIAVMPYRNMVSLWATLPIMYLFQGTILGIPEEKLNPWITTTMTMFVWVTGSSFFYYVTDSGMITLYAFKLGSLTRASLKDIFKAALIAMVVMIVAATLAIIAGIYIIPEKEAHWYGDLKASGYLFTLGINYAKGRDSIYWGKLEGASVAGDLLNTWGKVGIGVLVSLLLTFLRVKYPWFRISAAGLALGSTSMGPMIWTAFLVALIIKQLIFRIGGAKLYLEKIRPLCIGLVAGWLLIYPLSHIIVPFYVRWIRTWM